MIVWNDAIGLLQLLFDFILLAAECISIDIRKDILVQISTYNMIEILIYSF
jgi:hypothetical protein